MLNPMQEELGRKIEEILEGGGATTPDPEELSYGDLWEYFCRTSYNCAALFLPGAVPWDGLSEEYKNKIKATYVATVMAGHSRVKLEKLL